MQFLMTLPVLGLFQIPLLVFVLYSLFRQGLLSARGALSFDTRCGLSRLEIFSNGYFVVEKFLLGCVGATTVIYILLENSNWSPIVFSLFWWCGLVSFFASLGLLAIIGLGREVSCFLISIALVALLSYFFLSPATAYNYDDDLAKYFPILLWIRQTGGADMGPLGPQFPLAQLMNAGLQALYLGNFKLTELAYWDLFLGLGVIIFAGCFVPFTKNSITLRVGFIIFLTGSLLLVNPMYVNVSPLYLGPSIGFLCMVLLLGPGSSFRPARASFIIGSACAMIFFMKSPFFIISAAVFLCLFSRLVIFHSKQMAFVSAFLSIVPFVFVHGSYFFSPIVSALSKFIKSDAELADTSYVGGAIAASPVGLSSIFDTEPNFYGFGSISYLSVTIFLLSIIFASISMGVSLLSRERYKAAIGRLSSEPIQFPIFLFFSGFVLLFGISVLQVSGMGALDANLRYFMPSVLFLVLIASMSSFHLVGRSSSVLPVLSILIFFLGSNFPAFIKRAEQQVHVGNQLSFPAAKSDFLAKYTRYAFSDASRSFFESLQSVVPEGARILVHVGLPWRFDLERNNIEVAEANGRLGLFSQGPCDYLSSRNIDYVIWQRVGLGVRNIEQWQDWGDSASGRKKFSIKVVEFLKAMEAISERFPSYQANDSFTIVDVTSCDKG